MWEPNLSSHELAWLQWSVVISAALAAAATDLGRGTIPNRLTGPLFLSGVVWASAAGGLAGLAEGAAAALLLAFPFVLLFLLGGGGGGDAKLMGGIGAWLGIGHGAVALVGVAVAGVVLGLALALARGRLGAVVRRVGTAARSGLLLVGGRMFRDVGAALPAPEEMETMPYGVAIFLGVALAGGGVLLCSV